MLSRRSLLTGTGIVAGGFGCAALFSALQSEAAPPVPGHFEITHSDGEWRKLLKADQYAVLRQSDTERPYTSALLSEHGRGTFNCIGCDQVAFSSTTKYDSQTGWPSFWAPVDHAVGTSEDRSFRTIRTAVHCSRCGSHLGHVFNDGPEPTGLRYCMNGVAMAFKSVRA